MREPPPKSCGTVTWGTIRAFLPTGVPENLQSGVAVIVRALLLVSFLTGLARGQLATPENPVYVDDAPAARDVLLRLDDLIAQGSIREAVREVQQVLDTNAERVLPSSTDEGLFVSVRTVLRQRLIDDPALLAAYRETIEPEAASLLERSRLEELVRTRVLTPSGYEGVLRLAQLHVEAARFEAALRTLQELVGHPDFNQRRDDAIALARLIARYIEHDGAEALMQQWNAGVVLERIEPPSWIDRPGLGAMSVGPDTNIAGIVPRPLASVSLSPIQAPEPSAQDAGFVPRRGVADRDGGVNWTLPAAMGDVVYTNDGDTITAWDRFTLRQVWRVARRQEQSDDLFQQIEIRRRQSRRIEDASEVTVYGDRIIAVTGLAISGTRQGDGRAHCIDRHSGRVIWSVDPAELDPQLSDGSIRGPAEVVEGTVVFAVRKSARERRIVSVYLVGLDIEDGSLKWTRLIGSAGALPFQTSARFAERLSSGRGLIFRGDEIGIIAAVRADNGQVQWVRRYPSFRLYDNDVRPAWASTGPVVRDNSVFAISPDREQVVRLDAETGARLGQIDASRLGEPFYLLATRSHLVAVGESRLAWMRFDEFPRGRVELSEELGPPAVVGRASVAGERVVVPRDGFITTIDTASGEEVDTAVDRAGNVLALDGQLLVADRDSLHSYMVWEVASELLAQRVEDDPDNPVPAATLAELAYRAGKFDRIIESVDLALATIARDPQAHESTRAALFQAVLDMLDPDSSRQSQGAQTRITDLSTLMALSERLEALAEQPEELVAHRLIEARLREAGGQPARAVESLQEILADSLLASSFWQGGQLTIRADLEATRRLRGLLMRRGWTAYRAFEREAQAQLDFTPERSDAKVYESLAEQYPFSTLAPRFWLLAGERSDQTGALRAFDRGVRATEALTQVGARVDPNVAGELFGRLISGLVQAGRPGEARAVAERMANAWAGANPTLNGTLIDVEQLLASASSTPGPKRAIIGSAVVEQRTPRLEQGRVLSATLEKNVPCPTDAVVLASPSSQTLRMLALDESGTLVERWSRKAPFEPILLEHTASDVLIAWLDPVGVILEMFDAMHGNSIWRLRPFELPGVQDGVNRAALLDGFVTPLEGRVFSDQVLVASDETMVAVAERSGRVVTIDRISGQVLWSGQSTVQRVFDMALGGGMLVLAGSKPDSGESWTAGVVALNARTGLVSSRLDEPPGTVRWVRLTDQGLMITGLDRGLVCVDINQSQVRWMLSEEPAVASLDAWIFGQDLYVLDQDRALWRIEVGSGRLLRPELETRGRLMDRVGIRAVAMDSKVLFASGSGLLVYDRLGTLVGIDVFDTVGALVSSEPGQSIIAMMDTAPFESPDRLSSFMLHLLSVDTGRLLATYPVRLPATPESVSLLNGLILISAGEATLVLQAPAP